MRPPGQAPSRLMSPHVTTVIRRMRVGNLLRNRAVPRVCSSHPYSVQGTIRASSGAPGRPEIDSRPRRVGVRDRYGTDCRATRPNSYVPAGQRRSCSAPRSSCARTLPARRGIRTSTRSTPSALLQPSETATADDRPSVPIGPVLGPPTVLDLHRGTVRGTK